jgi:hypothetical protein
MALFGTTIDKAHAAARVIRAITALFALLLAGVTLGGCGGTSYGRLDVQVGLSEQIRGQTVDVDLIGVKNAQDLEAWRAAEITKYFSAGDTKRAEAASVRETFKFSAGDTASKTLSAMDRKWDEDWKGATAIIIVANIPGMEGEKGPADPRRTIITTEKGIWSETPVRVEVGRSGVRVLTPQNPPKS